jgi:ribosome maturation factor RimP
MHQRADGLTVEVRARLAELGYELADLQLKGAGSRVRLQVRIDRPDATRENGITVDECATVSRALESWLDAAGTLGERYVLEVSSPGIERPLRWREHWERFVGQRVRVRLVEGGRFQAVIEGTDADRDAVVLRLVDSGELRNVPLAGIRDAALVVDWGAVERDAARRSEGKDVAKEHG